MITFPAFARTRLPLLLCLACSWCTWSIARPDCTIRYFINIAFICCFNSCSIKEELRAEYDLTWGQDPEKAKTRICSSSSVCPCVHCPPRKICFGFLTISQERNSYRRSVGLKTTGFFRAYMISAWVTWSERPKGTKDKVKQVQSLLKRLPPGRLPDFYVIYFLQIISKDL